MSDQLERMMAVAAERQARESVLDTSQDLTTDQLEAYWAAKDHRESLGLSEREIGEWEIEQHRGYER